MEEDQAGSKRGCLEVELGELQVFAKAEQQPVFEQFCEFSTQLHFSEATVYIGLLSGTIQRLTSLMTLIPVTTVLNSLSKSANFLPPKPESN